MPCVSDILLTSLFVDDLTGAVAFYRDLFGFEVATPGLWPNA